MKISFFLGGFKTNGGIGRVTSILANAFVQKEEYDVFTLSFYRQDLPNLYILDPKINEDYLFDGPLNMTKAMLKGGIGKLRKYLKDNQIDCLIVCGALYFPLATLAAKGLKTKVIAWEHSNARNKHDHKFQMQSRYMGAKFADAVVTLTKADQAYYKSDFNSKNVYQIYNPVDESLSDYVKEYDETAKKILSIGRLTYQKNFENLVEVAHVVLPKYPEWQWDIYGEGDDRQKLEDLIAQCGLGSQLNLKGQVSNLYQRYSQYSFQVMTSRYEGFPMSLLEGMTTGLPLISYDIETGPNEIIQNGDNGFLINAFDTNDMAAKVMKLIEEKDLRLAMSEKNHQLKQQYQLEEILHEWEHLFKEITT